MSAENTDIDPPVRPSPLRLLLIFAPLALFGTLAVIFLVRIGENAALIPSALIGQPVPEFALEPVDGLVENGAPIPGFSTADLTGDVTVVNVWASWCVPCREENPMLLEMERQGIRVVGISYKDAPENARRFLGQFGNPFSAVGSDRRGRTAIDWGVYGVPETFVVNAEGTIVHKHVGPFNAQQLRETILPAIEAAR
ncbi:MAG: DsbE family thiol:disulfide interchange protein [Pseudomonadota bacterium]